MNSLIREHPYNFQNRTPAIVFRHKIYPLPFPGRKSSKLESFLGVSTFWILYKIPGQKTYI